MEVKEATMRNTLRTAVNDRFLCFLLPVCVCFSFSLGGCSHKGALPSAQSDGTAVKLDPFQEQYKKLRTSDFEEDAAVHEIDDSMEASKALAPKAGGDATKALLSVAGLLDGAGEALGDYEPVADTFEEFKKDFAAQDDRRLRAIKASIDSLSKLEDALDILSDLFANAPPDHKQDLEAIIDNVGQAQSDLKQCVTEMGGQLPAETDTESQDPVQDGGKTP